MKAASLLMMIMILSLNSYAQTLPEWMQQKKTQIKYLTQQVAALRVYGGYMKDGYAIASKGLNKVSDIKNNEWGLHRDVFTALKSVNPQIGSHGRVADIIAMQLQITRNASALIKGCRNESFASTKEIKYVEEICNRVLIESARNLDELILIITPGEWQMSDDQRIKAVNNIFRRVQEAYVFIQNFSGTITSLLWNKSHENAELKLSKILNNLK